MMKELLNNDIKYMKKKTGVKTVQVYELELSRRFLIHHELLLLMLQIEANEVMSCPPDMCFLFPWEIRAVADSAFESHELCYA